MHVRVRTGGTVTEEEQARSEDRRLDAALRDAGRAVSDTDQRATNAVLDLAIALSDPGVRLREEADRRMRRWWKTPRATVAGGVLVLLLAGGGLAAPALGLPGWADVVAPRSADQTVGLAPSRAPSSQPSTATSGAAEPSNDATGPAATVETNPPRTLPAQPSASASLGFSPPQVSPEAVANPLPGAGPWSLDKDDPRIFLATESLYPGWLPLPGGYSRADVIWAKWGQFYPVGTDDYKVILERSDVEGSAERFATCAWYESYADAFAHGDEAGQRAAVIEIAKTPSWASMVSEAPLEDRGYYKTVSDALTGGDAGPMFANRQRMNCDDVLAGRQW